MTAEPTKRIVVVGAGAIGGTIGAYLARAGLPIAFCDAAADHVAAINQRGLTIRGWAEEFSVNVGRLLERHRTPGRRWVLVASE